MTQVSYDLGGRVAVVTGGAAGIGAEVARRYHEAGAQVVVWDLKAAGPPGVPCDLHQVDVAELGQVEDALAATLARRGRIDILSHNAGFAGPAHPVVETEPKAWETVVDVNLIGTYRVCRSVVPAMLEQGSGRIVLMASLAGKEGTANASAYSASKAGVIAFTKSLGKELAGTDIRVNCIAPAAIETAIIDQMAPEHVQIMIDKSPMKRFGTVAEAAEMVLWLSSSACTFNAGAVFDLSGGRATY